jgi:hypothetical protein
MTRLMSLALLCLVLCSAPVMAEEAPRCGPKLKKKEVTVYEVGEFQVPAYALREVQEQHGQALHEVLTETVQADRNAAKEARRRAAAMGCPYVVVGPQEELVVSIRYEAGRTGTASLPVEEKVYRARVVFADADRGGVSTDGEAP